MHRAQEELRRASEANSTLQRSHASQQLRVLQLRERLDTIVQSLRAFPPSRAAESPAQPARRQCSSAVEGCTDGCGAACSSPISSGCEASAGEAGGHAEWSGDDALVPRELYDQLQREVKMLRAQLRRLRGCDHTPTRQSVRSAASPTTPTERPSTASPLGSAATSAVMLQDSSQAGSGANAGAQSPGSGTGRRAGASACSSAPRLPVGWRR